MGVMCSWKRRQRFTHQTLLKTPHWRTGRLVPSRDCTQTIPKPKSERMPNADPNDAQKGLWEVTLLSPMLHLVKTLTGVKWCKHIGNDQSKQLCRCWGATSISWETSSHGQHRSNWTVRCLCEKSKCVRNKTQATSCWECSV